MTFYFGTPWRVGFVPADYAQGWQLHLGLLTINGGLPKEDEDEDEDYEPNPDAYFDTLAMRERAADDWRDAGRGHLGR